MAVPGVKRFELVIVAAIAVSSTSFIQAFDGGISVAAAFVRFAVALVICAALGAIVERTIDAYARDARQKEIERRIAQALASRESFWKTKTPEDPK